MRSASGFWAVRKAIIRGSPAQRLIHPCSRRLLSYVGYTLEQGKDRDDSHGESARDKRERIEWLKHFQQLTSSNSQQPQPNEDQKTLFPKSWIITSFSRSSGPGGQNVNKVNTKADVRLLLTEAAKTSAADAEATFGDEKPSSPETSTSNGEQQKRRLQRMPKAVVRFLVRNSTYYVGSSHVLHITSSQSRSQADNVRTAYDKLVRHITSVLGRDVQGETSEEQKQRVRSLIAKDKQRTRRAKDKRKDVKSSRRVSHGDL